MMVTGFDMMVIDVVWHQLNLIFMLIIIIVTALFLVFNVNGLHACCGLPLCI